LAQTGKRGIDNLRGLTSRRLHEYRLWRRNVGELSPASEKTRMDTVRVFIRWFVISTASIPACTYRLNCGAIACNSHIKTERLEGESVCTGCAVTDRFALKTKCFYDEETCIEMLWFRGALDLPSA
jgi:hypothetical protein